MNARLLLGLGIGLGVGLGAACAGSDSTPAPEQVDSLEAQEQISREPVDTPDAGLAATAEPTAEPEVQPPELVPEVAVAVAPPPPEPRLELCRQTASDGCESLRIAHLQADGSVCTLLTLDNCPTYNQRGLRGVDVPFDWRLATGRVLSGEALSNPDDCQPDLNTAEGTRVDAVAGEVTWDEDAADPVPDELEFELVVSWEDDEGELVSASLSTAAPQSTRQLCTP